MVIRLFDDQPSIQAVALVTCPDCKGEGEVTVGTPTQDSNGVWSRDTTTCVPCLGYGAVPEAAAHGCASCPATFWVEDACADHDHLCPACHPAGCPEWADTAEADPWPIGGAA